MDYGEWCPKCGAKIVVVTRGFPSIGICVHGHETDRRDVLRREPESELSKAQAEIASLRAEVKQLRADLANAGAVMVEALIERLHICDDEARAIADRISGPIGQPSRCPDAVQVLEDAETIIRAATRALSTLSPIAAAARVLLADADTLDGFKGYILNRHDMDATVSDYAEGAMDYLRALAEQEKADG